MNFCYYLLLCLVVIFYRAFSSTCLAPMQIYWNKKKRLHKKSSTPAWLVWDTYKNWANYSKSNICGVEKWPEADHCFVFPYERVVWYLYLRLLSLEKLLSWLVARPLSIAVNLRAKEGGKRKTGDTLPPSFFSPLPLVSCASSPVTRVSRSPMYATQVRKTKHS